MFSALVAQLVEANATLDASAVALRMAQDEFRHAETCGQVVRASVTRYLRHVFAVRGREFVREPAARAAGADDDALGLVPGDVAREVFWVETAPLVASGWAA